MSNNPQKRIGPIGWFVAYVRANPVPVVVLAVIGVLIFGSFALNLLLFI